MGWWCLSLEILRTRDVETTAIRGFAYPRFLGLVDSCFPLDMKTYKITPSLPASLERAVRLQIREAHYPGESDYGLGLILWDIYSRQPHTITTPLMRLPRRALEATAYDLAEELGMAERGTRHLKPYRPAVYVPVSLRPLVNARMEEEGYKSGSAYVTALMFFSLKIRAPDKRKVPHHKCAPLLREPEWVRKQAFAHFVKDFGNPERKWPKDFGKRIDEVLGGYSEQFPA